MVEYSFTSYNAVQPYIGYIPRWTIIITPIARVFHQILNSPSILTVKSEARLQK